MQQLNTLVKRTGAKREKCCRNGRESRVTRVMNSPTLGKPPARKDYGSVLAFMATVRTLVHTDAIY